MDFNPSFDPMYGARLSRGCLNWREQGRNETVVCPQLLINITSLIC
jgi:hypothetical protein